MPPPANGNEYIPFTQLIALEPLSRHIFRSKALAFGPAGGDRTYGGHVFMQAAYAAAQTVGRGWVLHNITGYFLQAGKASERFIYTVRTIRDGGYSTRGVDVVQESDPAMCFTCICSFKKPEKPNAPSLDQQQQIDLRREYAAVLEGLRPEEHEEMPGIDTPWYWDYSKRNNGYTDPFPGLNLRKVDMSAYNSHRDPFARRNLKFYSVRGAMPSIEDDPNIHACAHLYASDRNSLFVISNAFDVGNNYSTIASLSHTVTLHAAGAELSTTDPVTGEPLWFCQEARAGGSRHGRAFHVSRLWRWDVDVSTGQSEGGMRGHLHVASTSQDGMLRLKGPGLEGKLGFQPDMLAALEKKKDAAIEAKEGDESQTAKKSRGGKL